MEKRFKTVVMVGLDGAGEYIKDADIPNIKRIFGDNIKFGVKAVLPTISAECWGTMFTGLPPEIHGFTNHKIKRERHPADSNCPTFFNLLRKKYDALNLVSICNWDPINFGIIEEHIGVKKLTGENDREITDKFIAEKEKLKTGLYFLHLDETDDAGHDFGFGSSEYLETIHKDDMYIGEIYDYLKTTENFKDTLFILLTDHGGKGNEHGGDSNEEKYVFFASTDYKGNSYNDDINEEKDVFKFILETFGYYDMEKIKILLLNGSPHKNGTTYTALHEMEKVFSKYDVDFETIEVGNQLIRGCMGCKGCGKTGKCVYDDDIVNEVAKKFKDADGLVVGSPVYYASANATLIALLDRMFYSSDFDKTMKVGASVCAARRGGITATFDELNKYFAISGMPIVSGQYWNGIHGVNGAQALDDEEGCQMMRTLAENMVFLIRSIKLGLDNYGLPEKERPLRTNFIR